MAKGTIIVSVENIFPLIKKFLYSDHEIFLRELISNATDATMKLKHLTNIGESAPYLHDGRSQTLEEIWTVFGNEDRHGVVSDLTKSQLNDLVEYLRSL